MWVERAARNNAEWCDAVAASHGLIGTFHRHVWACGSRTPPFYPDAVTLDAGATPDDVLAHVDRGTPGCSVKDSFATLDLGPAGFRVLFDATWIARATSGADNRVPDSWSPVTDAHALDRWRRASDRLIPDQLLGRDDVVIVAGAPAESDDEVVGGCVFNRSDSVVGISNVFAGDHDLDAVWSACVAFADDRFPDVPVVGYEAGAPLVAALGHGFVPVGQLRVWMDGTVQ